MRRFKQEVFFITEQDKQAKGGRAFEMVSHSTLNCTVSEQYSCQHEVALCALWSVLQVGESSGHQVVVGQLPTHTGCCGYKSTLNGCEGAGCVSSPCDGGRRVMLNECSHCFAV